MKDLTYIGNPKDKIQAKKDEYIQVSISSGTTENCSFPKLSAQEKNPEMKSIEVPQCGNQTEEGEIKEKPSPGKILKYMWKREYNEKHVPTVGSFSQPKLVRKTSSTLELPRRLAISELELIKSQKVLIFGGIDPYCTKPAENHGKEVLWYDIYLNHWKRLASMPRSRHHHSAVFCQGKVYVIGGTRPAQNNLKPTLAKSMWSFDVKTLEWTNEKPLPFPRRDFGLVATARGLHVIGGENCARTLLSSHLFYDISTKKWSKKSPLKVARSGLACAALGWHIWAAGGIIDNHGVGVMTNIVESYEFKDDMWYEIYPLRIPRCYAKLCVLNRSNIYIVGGVTIDKDKQMYVSLASIDQFFFEFREWKEVTSMSIARHGHDLVGIADKIFIFGGVSTQLNTALEAVECLWTDNMTWIMGMSPMHMPTSGLAVVAINE